MYTYIGEPQTGVWLTLAPSTETPIKHPDSTQTQCAHTTACDAVLLLHLKHPDLSAKALVLQVQQLTPQGGMAGDGGGARGDGVCGPGARIGHAATVVGGAEGHSFFVVHGGCVLEKWDQRGRQDSAADSATNRDLSEWMYAMDLETRRWKRLPLCLVKRRDGVRGEVGAPPPPPPPPPARPDPCRDESDLAMVCNTSLLLVCVGVCWSAGVGGVWVCGCG
jgi:hypothetical protein